MMSNHVLKVVQSQEAGLAIGGPEFNPYIMMEVHFNNQNKESGNFSTKVGLRGWNCDDIAFFDAR